MKWIKGRLGTGYEKLPLIRTKRFDCYVLRMRPFSYISEHVDPVPGYRHYRLNVLLKDALLGGEFRCDGAKKLGPFTLFRPDVLEHLVTAVQFGNRYVLSFGFTLKEK